MIQVKFHNATPISMEYKHPTDTKADKYILRMGSIKRNYPVPQEASQMFLTAEILLEQFYRDNNMELPKNGFNLFRFDDKTYIAIPLQD